jgi:hypothetical protein
MMPVPSPQTTQQARVRPARHAVAPVGLEASRQAAPRWVARPWLDIAASGTGNKSLASAGDREPSGLRDRSAPSRGSPAPGAGGKSHRLPRSMLTLTLDEDISLGLDTRSGILPARASPDWASRPEQDRRAPLEAHQEEMETESNVPGRRLWRLEWAKKGRWRQ